MTKPQLASLVAWIGATATILVVLLGTRPETARPEDEPAYSVTVESSNRDRTVLRITVRQDVDFQDLHLLPFERPPLNPPRQLPGIRQKRLVLGGAVFELVPSPRAGMLCFLKMADQPKTGKGTYRVELDWTYPAGARIDYIGVEVDLTTNRDATRWTAADIVGGHAAWIDPVHRIPAIVPPSVEESPRRILAGASTEDRIDALIAVLVRRKLLTEAEIAAEIVARGQR